MHGVGTYKYAVIVSIDRKTYIQHTHKQTRKQTYMLSCDLCRCVVAGSTVPQAAVVIDNLADVLRIG